MVFCNSLQKSVMQRLYQKESKGHSYSYQELLQEYWTESWHIQQICEAAWRSYLETTDVCLLWAAWEPSFHKQANSIDTVWNIFVHWLYCCVWSDEVAILVAYNGKACNLYGYGSYAKHHGWSSLYPNR